MSDPIRDCPHGHKKGKCDSCDLIVAEQRIAELEQVAEAAVRMWNSDGLTDELVQALQNAGYNVEVGEHL